MIFWLTYPTGKLDGTTLRLSHASLVVRGKLIRDAGRVLVRHLLVFLKQQNITMQTLTVMYMRDQEGRAYLC
jgi:hypothetical protein